MITILFSRLIIVVVGTLYPAYCSYKAIQLARSSKNANEMGHWLMYWIVYALFSLAETFADTLVSWFPFYYEMKLLFVFWLVLPITKGSRYLYKKFVHPYLEKHEQDIDAYINKAGEKGLETIKKVSQQGINFAATTMVTSAIKGQAAVTDALQRSRENSSSNLQQSERSRDNSISSQQQSQRSRESSSSQRPSHSDLEQYELIDVDNYGGYQATSVSHDHTEHIIEQPPPADEATVVQPRRSKRKLPTPHQ